MSKVSVVVPVYNSEKTLKRCLDSILDQSFVDFEVLLVNDGSTDSSLRIAEYYAEHDDRIRIFSQENQGPSTARNTGIENASGNYVYFVDSDDYIAHDAIEKLYFAALSSGADVTICGLYHVKDETIEEHKTYYKPGIYGGEESKNIALDLLNNHSHRYLPPYSVIRLIRRDVLENPPLRFNEKIIRSEDYLFTTELHFRIDILCLITDQLLYYYVDNENSITNTFVVSYWQMAKSINEVLLRKLPDSRLIKEKLDSVLIYRAQFAFSNAARAVDKKAFNSEIDTILQDEVLFNALRSISLCEVFKRFKAFYRLLRLRLKYLVKLRYYVKYCQFMKGK